MIFYSLEIDENALGLPELNSSKMSTRAGEARTLRNNQAARLFNQPGSASWIRSFIPQKKRGGSEFILNTLARRAILLAGLVGTVVLALI